MQPKSECIEMARFLGCSVATLHRRFADVLKKGGAQLPSFPCKIGQQKLSRACGGGLSVTYGAEVSDLKTETPIKPL